MGLGGISPWSLVIILLIVVLLFGTKKLRNMGGDLGGALKNFKNAMNDEGDKEKDKLENDTAQADANPASAEKKAAEKS